MEIKTSSNFVCIDVDTFYVADENKNINSKNVSCSSFNDFTQVMSSNKSNLPNDETALYKCDSKPIVSNKIKSNTAEKRLKYAQTSPNRQQLMKSILYEKKDSEKSSSKGSAHFDEVELSYLNKVKRKSNSLGLDESLIKIVEPNPSDTNNNNNSFTANNMMDNAQHYIPRKSLLGKPISVRNYSRQDAQYRKLQSKIYNFLERPKNWQAVGYHIIVFASVFTCLVLSVLSTIDGIGESAGEFLFYVELSVLFWFFTEYCMRLWSAGCRSRFQTWRGRLLFAKQPFCLVDLIVILASIVVLALGSDRQMFAASALRGLRFFQILRMIRMDRRGGSWKLLASVVWAHRQELFTTIYIGFLVLVFSSFLIYLVEKDEKDENNRIRSYADALWWGVITLCTVGYGDTVPKTALGKLIAGCCSIAGISFFALPAGILGSGFALKVQQHQRHKHLIRRRMPAASLIQCLWRCYSSDPQSISVATWKPHLKSFRPSTLDKSTNQVDSSIFNAIGAVDKLAKFSRLSTIKRRCEKLTNSTGINPRGGASSSSALTHSLSSSTIGLNRSKLKELEEDLVDEEDDTVNNSLNSDYPEQRSSSPGGNSNAVYPIFRRNALAQSVDKNKEEDRKKFGILDDFFLNRYTSVASMTREEVEDIDGILAKRELTQSEKNAIRFIRKIKFFVAARKFKEALRPYDLKDIIEQYSSGHVDMLARIKGLQARLDNLFGRHDVKDTMHYDPRISLATRIVKIENKVENIELKLDKILTLMRHQNTGTHQLTPTVNTHKPNPALNAINSPVLYHKATTVGFTDDHILDKIIQPKSSPLITHQSNNLPLTTIITTTTSPNDHSTFSMTTTSTTTISSSTIFSSNSITPRFLRKFDEV